MSPPTTRDGASRRLDDFVADPRRGLWKLAVPMMLGMSVHTIYMIVDMIFVGRVSSKALTALAFNMPLLFFGIGVTFGLGSGITAVLAQFIGAREKRQADNTAEHAVVLGLAMSTLFALVGLTSGRWLLTTLGVTAELMQPAWDYFRILAGGYVFGVMSVFFRSILSGEGNMKTPMIILGAATVLNILLDPILIFGLGMGVKGAALATVVSQACATGVFLYLLFAREHAYVTFSMRSFRLSGSILGSILKIGAPASFSFLIMAFGGGVFNRILISLSGDAVAAYQVGMRLDHVFVLPITAIATGLVTLVGMFVGAGRPDLVRQVVAYALSRATLISMIVGALFFGLAPKLIALFSEDPGIRAAGTTYLRIMVFGYPFVGFCMLTGRILQGMGRGVPLMVITALRVLLLSTPLAYGFVFWLDKPVQWVWIAMVTAVACTAAVAALWLRSALLGMDNEVRPVENPAYA
jgi:putative MATE family efflux protein